MLLKGKANDEVAPHLTTRDNYGMTRRDSRAI
jgi:hypothetical protein